MRQIALLDHSKGTAFIRDIIDDWIVEADDKGWEIIDIFIPSGGLIAIVYEVTDKDEIEEIKRKVKERKNKKV